MTLRTDNSDGGAGTGMVADAREPTPAEERTVKPAVDDAGATAQELADAPDDRLAGARAGDGGGAKAGDGGATPAERLRPTMPEDGLGARLGALGKYLMRTEVHTYAFSVAANSILALFPFLVLLLTLSRALFHSRSVQPVITEFLKSFLPTGQDFVMRNMQLLAHPRGGMQIFSLLMLLFSSTGVFLPLEVALNHVWGVTENRSYLRNQIVSFLLAFAVGLLALGSMMLSADQHVVLQAVFFGHTEGRVFEAVSRWFLHVMAGGLSVGLFFLIYWVLPNRKVPAMAVLPTAVVVGVLWEGAKVLYIHALPWLDFQAVYGPFYISVGLMMWAFLSGLLLLAGAHFSATRYTLRLLRRAAETKPGEEGS